MAPQDLAYASFLCQKLQRLQWPHRDRHASFDTRCDVCGASFHQLRRLTLRRALGISREAVPPSPATHPTSAGGYGDDELPPKLQRWSYEEQQGGGALGGWGRVHSAYLGGGGAKGLATVTSLPLTTQQDLEGLWRVSCCRPELQQDTTVRRRDKLLHLSFHPVCKNFISSPQILFHLAQSSAVNYDYSQRLVATSQCLQSLC